MKAASCQHHAAKMKNFNQLRLGRKSDRICESVSNFESREYAIMFTPRINSLGKSIKSSENVTVLITYDEGRHDNANKRKLN